MTTMEQGNSSVGCLPKFFRVYLADESGDDLELPLSFNSFLPNSLPKTVTVRSLYGKIWRIALRKCGGDVEKYVMVDGWKRIAKDEELKGGDFLAFEFDGSRCFNLCVYEGRTMCKRLRSCSEKTNEISEESNDEEENRVSEDVRVSDDDDDDSKDVDYDYVDDDDDYDVEDLGGKDEVDVENHGDEDEANDVDDADVEDLGGKDEVDVENHGDEDEANDVDDADVEDHGDEAEASVDEYGDDDVVKDVPSFTMTLNPKKKSQLFISALVIKDYNLNFSDNITIVDPLAKNFGTLKRKIKIQANGSVFVKRFGSIIRRNNVKTTDKMIFELKTGNNNLVHTVKLDIIRG